MYTVFNVSRFVLFPSFAGLCTKTCNKFNCTMADVLLSFVQKTVTLSEFYLPSKVCQNSNVQYLNKIENVTDNLLLSLLLLLGNIHLCLTSTLISSAEYIVHEQSPGNHLDQDLIIIVLFETV